MNDPRIDAYIAGAPEFARPILEAVRKRMHASVAGLEETMKWSSPHFSYQGGLFAGMAAFKKHCTFGFWHLMMRGGDTSLEGMGRFRLKSVDDLPPAAEFRKLARAAKRLVDEGVKAPPKARVKRKPLRMPADLATALAGNARARAAYEAFSPTRRREYVEWIGEAKREETRTKRVATAVAQLAEGKTLYWKYERK
jgi:uncharacterized protein YdeI (YjbR/CyaY-like superfamily)